ncbi:tyrosine-protein kinase BAZ1B-like [Haliotis rufescens]|uniref:tyrosine-protein kinase BAZ1B-like n=1 Tax=Haliotis rufescens TaxID=6454 RepID=UPI001EB09EEE|nr:tyrosine-protein kinase BAZ1B-like [Haliotis rufescens]
MPLLGKKVFNCLKPLNDIKAEEAVFTIPHTKEQFRSKAEFEKRKDLYGERIWTCQCTGHINLTHEEAWNSEKAVQKTLKNQFAACYEKSVLEIVHHSTLSLDTLVDQAWLKLQQVLCVTEKINLRIKSTGNAKGFSGTVVSIDTSGVQANPTSNCSSPSSDKENSSGEGKESSPKKWVPPKLLPYKYSIKLEEEDKIINGIPACDLVRVDRPPSKELLRLFIRASALRVGTTSTSPWVVNDALVNKYSLPSKFADFLVSPAKMAEAAKRAEEEGVRKRKHHQQHKQPMSAKKLKITKSSKMSDSKRGNSSVKKRIKKKDKDKSPVKKKKVIDEILIESESSDDEVLANLKNSNDSDSDTPLVSLKSQLTPKKKKKKESDDSDSDTPLSKLTPKKKKLKLDSGSQKSRSPKKSHTKTASKPGKKLSAATGAKKRGRPRKDAPATPSKKVKRTPTKKGMKQMTLLDIAGKKGSPRTPSKSVRKSAPPPTPKIVRKILKLSSESDHNRVKYAFLVKQAAMTLTSQQKSNLPAPIKDIILKKCEQLNEKRLMEKMTPEERNAYVRVKKQKVKAVRQQERKEQNKKYEDLDLQSTPLPTPKPVHTPDGLPNECFGDVAMVTQFLSSYWGLLMPDDEYPIYSDDLMTALASGLKGSTYVARVLVVLLQTLLQDEIAEDYKELRVKLGDVPINPYTASELVRLCLRRNDTGVGHTDDSYEDDNDSEVPDQIIQQLETQEFHELEAESKLKVLSGLCLRLLGTYSIQDYMENKQQEASQLSRQKYAELKEKNVKLKEEKQKRKDEGKGKGEDQPEEKPAGATLNYFYGKKEGETDSGSAAGDSMDDVEGDDLISVVKRRRLMTAKQSAEREKKEKERKEQKEREYQEYRKQLEREKFAKTFKDGMTLARNVLRQTPIGTDRNHCRYWLFNSTIPGLYIEKGWVNAAIDYNCQGLGDRASSAPNTPKKADSVTSGSQPNTPSKLKKKKSETESTTPRPGQNLWFSCDSVEDLDTLLKALQPRGIRESNLKSEIQKKYDDLSKAMTGTKTQDKEVLDSEITEDDLVNGFRKELIDAELRLRNGGLGGIPMFDEWEAKVSSATDIKDLGACLKEVQKNVAEKFFKGFMKPRYYMYLTQVKEIKEEEDKAEDEDDEDVIASKAVVEWFDALETCPTFSRLHVLLGMLDSCIRWEKSAENAKCKICRKKGNDEAVLLCDECNQAFHMYCLRPALVYIPKGDWFCPACIPQSKRRHSREVKRYNEDANSDDDLSDNVDEREPIEHDQECYECAEEGGDLVECGDCPSVYHLDCHNPPLRHLPRGYWECGNCKSGGRSRRGRGKSARKKTRASNAKVKYNQSSEEEEEDEEEESESDAETPRKTKSSRRTASAKKETTSSGTRSSSRKREPVRETLDQKPIYSRRPPSELSICEEILDKVMKHKSSWPFLEAVDKKEVPDYYVIVKHPMDFHTMKNKLARLSYSSPEEVIKETALVFRNAAQYNKEDSEVYQCMLEVEKVFVEILSKKLPFYHYSRDPVANGYDDHGYSNRKRSRR